MCRKQVYSTVVSRAGVVQLGFEKLRAERGRTGLTWEGFSEEVSEGKAAKMSEERQWRLTFLDECQSSVGWEDGSLDSTWLFVDATVLQRSLFSRNPPIASEQIGRGSGWSLIQLPRLRMYSTSLGILQQFFAHSRT